MWVLFDTGTGSPKLPSIDDLRVNQGGRNDLTIEMPKKEFKSFKRAYQSYDSPPPLGNLVHHEDVCRDIRKRDEEIAEHKIFFWENPEGNIVLYVYGARISSVTRTTVFVDIR